jgi:hypothetical protein
MACNEGVLACKALEGLSIALSSLEYLKRSASDKTLAVQSRWKSLLCNPSYLGEDDIERFEDVYGRSTPSIEAGVRTQTIAR